MIFNDINDKYVELEVLSEFHESRESITLIVDDTSSIRLDKLAVVRLVRHLNELVSEMEYSNKEYRYALAFGDETYYSESFFSTESPYSIAQPTFEPNGATRTLQVRNVSLEWEDAFHD